MQSSVPVGEEIASNNPACDIYAPTKMLDKLDDVYGGGTSISAQPEK